MVTADKEIVKEVLGAYVEVGTGVEAGAEVEAEADNRRK